MKLSIHAHACTAWYYIQCSTQLLVNCITTYRVNSFNHYQVKHKRKLHSYLCVHAKMLHMGIGLCLENAYILSA